MELRHYLVLARQRWLLIAATVLVGVIGAYLLTPKATVYDASSTIVVGPRQFSTDAGSNDLSFDRTVGLERLTSTYAVMIKSLPIADDARQATGVQRSATGVVAATTTVAVPNTQLLLISVSDPDPAVAQSLANGLADAFVSKVTSFRADQPATVGTIPEVPVYVFARAPLPTAPRSTGLTSNLILGVLFALAAAFGLVLLLEYLDITIRSVEDAERRLELPVLGGIPLIAGIEAPARSRLEHREPPEQRRQSA